MLVYDIDSLIQVNKQIIDVLFRYSTASCNFNLLPSLKLAKHSFIHSFMFNNCMLCRVVCKLSYYDISAN